MNYNKKNGKFILKLTGRKRKKKSARKPAAKIKALKVWWKQDSKTILSMYPQQYQQETIPTIEERNLEESLNHMEYLLSQISLIEDIADQYNKLPL
ncbi:MAG: hypothetical protein LUG18_08315 [Candidatus Azobacteroides sp.]|nr:hypothetical protein [Candidatus Azobacteroides sp.]